MSDKHIPIFCPACDRQGIDSLMVKDTSTKAEGQVVRCLAQSHRFEYARLLALINEIGDHHYQRFVGRQTSILVEGPSRKNAARLMGRTPCNKIVVFDGSPRHLGQLMDVRVTRAGSFTLYGDPAIIALD